MDALSDLRFTREDAISADVRALLAHHFDVMRSNSPISSCHVMEPEELVDAQATLFAARRGDDLLGVGAIREIAPGHAELKSMHTAEAARGQGVGQALVEHLLDHARANGITRVSLETGNIDLYKPARALYARNGWARGSSVPVHSFGRDLTEEQWEIEL